MCDFVSWIEHPKKGILFLCDDDLKTRKGKELVKYLENQFRNDIIGHGSIRRYYGLNPNEGTNKECSDFGTPDKFPKEIVEAIKAGKFKNFEVATGILTPEVEKELNSIRHALYYKYASMTKLAQEERDKIVTPEKKKFEKIQLAARQEYSRKVNTLREKLAAAEGSLLLLLKEEYNTIEQAAWDEYIKITLPAQQEYEEKTNDARKKYNEITSRVMREFRNKVTLEFWRLAKDKKNRIEIWK